MKISFIIPVYNVEKYLSQCLDSVINQTYKNLEIICVDDCSTDNSRQILQEYAKKDDRIKLVFNEVNSKLGVARNNGYKIATGDYIHFLDSDDWMELDAYEKLFKVLVKSMPIDIIHFCVKQHWEPEDNIFYVRHSPKTLINQKINIDDNSRKYLENFSVVWNKLYSKKFLDEFNIVHNNYPCHEDMEFTLLIRLFARTIYYLDEVLIDYRINRPNSLMGNRYKYTNCVFKSYLNAEKWCQEFVNWEVGKYLLKSQFSMFKNHVIEAYANNFITYKDLVNMFKQINYDLLKDTVWHVELKQCKEISTNPQWYYELKTSLRQYTREKCPKMHDTLVKLRKKLTSIHPN